MDERRDASWTITFTRDDWKSHDNFYGGEPYGGRALVSCRGKPVWLMVYYGWVFPETDAAVAYGFLREALKAMPEEHPFRGPAVYEANDFRYANVGGGADAIHRYGNDFRGRVRSI